MFFRISYNQTSRSYTHAHSQMGTVFIPLKDIDQSGTVPVTRWYTLSATEKMSQPVTGELRISIKYSGPRSIKLSVESKAALQELQKKKDENHARSTAIKQQMERRELFARQAQIDADDEFAKQHLKQMQEDLRLRKIEVVKAEAELQAQLEEERLEAIRAEEVSVSVTQKQNSNNTFTTLTNTKLHYTTLRRRSNLRTGKRSRLMRTSRTWEWRG